MYHLQAEKPVSASSPVAGLMKWWAASPMVRGAIISRLLAVAACLVLLCGGAAAGYKALIYRTQRNAAHGQLAEMRQRLAGLLAEREHLRAALAREETRLAVSPAPAAHCSLDPEVHLAIADQEDQLYLAGMLAEIFPRGHKHLSAEQKCLEILKFVTAFLRAKNNSGTATKILQDGYAICGGRSVVFQTLARMVAVPARYVGIFGMSGGSHAMAEAYYDGQWHLFDPTYGVFFYSTSRYDGSGRVLSLQELLEHPARGTLFYVIPMPWEGKYGEAERRAVPVALSAGGWRHKVQIDELYRRWLVEAFPVWYDYQGTLSHVIAHDFDEQDHLAIGEADGTYRDVVQAAAARKQRGIHFLSKVGFHTHCLFAARPAIVEIEYRFLGDVRPRIEVLPLKSFLPLGIDEGEGWARITALIKDGLGVAAVFTRQDHLNIDYYRARKLADAPGFELPPVSGPPVTGLEAQRNWRLPPRSVAGTLSGFPAAVHGPGIAVLEFARLP
jgi:hypothetical protein